jgi:predicted DNA-binding protein
MGILTVRLTDEEDRLLTKRSRNAGMKRATYVRQLIRETPLVTSSDVLEDAPRRLGDERLRIARK